MNILGHVKLALVTSVLLAVAACSTTAPIAQTNTVIQHPAAITASASEPQQNAVPTQPQTQAVTPATKPIDNLGYKLGNGDTLRITVFGEPDLSGEFQVDGTGMISMPLVGEIAATGQSVRQVQRALEDLFRQGYLNNPRISAEVINFRPYYILGEVSRPGEYPYSDGLTVLNAIATAEGYTYRANKKVIFVRGAGDTAEQEITLTSSTLVKPGDTLRIGERLF